MEIVRELPTKRSELTVPYELHAQLESLYSDLHLRHEAQTLEMIDYKHKANYWEAQFQQVKKREMELNDEVEELTAKLRQREQQLFGRRSEKNTAASENNPNTNPTGKTKKKRGQQPGSVGHGRRDYNLLPTTIEEISLPKKEACCRCCGLPYQELQSYETSEILEVIHVQAHRRVIHRKRYKRKCRCKQNPDPQILLAPIADRLIPKSKLGISVWALLLVNKYEYQHPLYRTLEQLSNHGLSLAMGTVTDGMKRVLPLLTPVYDAITAHNLAANHWHADETGWKVFETKEGKANHRWYLWIFKNTESVVFKISDSRSSSVLMEHFGESHTGGILNVDRYAAYKVIAKSGLFILAFCWAHVRRDFLNYAKGYPKQEAWGLLWVERIANLYHINNQRIEHKANSKLFLEHDKQLRVAIKEMKKTCDEEMKDRMQLPSARKLLESLHNHWFGLTVFIDHPEIPMDNNVAERGLRSSVIGRKNYYGSGAIWSAQLSACMFTIFETLKIWNVNPHTWLLTYFYDCAIHGGQAPADIMGYLPWKMPKEAQAAFASPPKHQQPIESG
jgi:transposase